MALETENRVHAAAVCFWERTVVGPPTDRYRVGFLSRSNFAAVELPASDDSPDRVRLTFVRPIAKAQALPMLCYDVLTNMLDAGVSIGPPLTLTGDPSVDDTPEDAMILSELEPPDRIVGPGNVGDRALFYVAVLEIPITEEGG